MKIFLQHKQLSRFCSCIIAIGFLLFIGTSSTFSQSIPSKSELVFSIDAQTAKRGVTLANENRALTLGIPPGALPDAGRVVLRESALRDNASAFLPPRDGMRYASALFYYEFLDILSLRKEITLALESSLVSRKAGVYLYDIGSSRWFPLRTKIINAHYFRALSDSMSGYVAVLEYENDDAEFLSLLDSSAAVIAANADDQMYVVHNGGDVLPIASLTKLMTALVFLDKNPGWDTRVTIRASDDAQPAKIVFKSGDIATVRDLFSSMLVGSKNNSAKILRRSTGFSERQFVKKMNERARAIGMNDTMFVDVTGLSAKNTASARDVIILLRQSMAVPAIAAETSKKSTRVRLLNRKKTFIVKSTNDLAADGITIAAKTGYLPEAGYNLAFMKPQKNNPLYVAILGAPSSAERFALARSLLSRTW